MLLKKVGCYGLGFFLFILALPIQSFELSNTKLYWLENFYEDVKHDYCTYYQKDTLLKLGGVLVVSGIMANTNIDHSIHKFYRDNLSTKHSRSCFEPANAVGSFNYIKAYLGGILLGQWMIRRHDSIVGDAFHNCGGR